MGGNVGNIARRPLRIYLISQKEEKNKFPQKKKKKEKQAHEWCLIKHAGTVQNSYLVSKVR